MDYLYFDIECCDGNTMCSFGYVIVDDKFNIIEKKDILINPEKQFKLARSGFDARINLAYTEEEFTKHPNFENVYNEIKDLLIKENRTILGHSVDYDLKYLFRACKRYNKPEIKIKSYDTQNIYNKKNRVAIAKIVKELAINTLQLKEHKSCDDAEMSMLYIKAICEKQNITIDELLKQNQDSIKVYKLSSKKKHRIEWRDENLPNNIIQMQIKVQLKKKV